MAIEFYKEFGEYGYLANYAAYGFEKEGIYYKTVEHYYQSKKFENQEIINKIVNCDTPKEASQIGRDRANIRKNDFKNIKKQVMLEGVLEKFRQNKEICYKLIETRNEQIIENTVDEYYWGIGKEKNGKNNFGKILMQAREILKDEIVEQILQSCKNKKIYIIGHSEPDADSIFSCYILCNILKKNKIESEFCVFDKNYTYCGSDSEMIKDFLPKKPVVISEKSIKNKNNYFLLVDHNSNQMIPNNKILGAFDHHKIINKDINILEMEYASTGLLIYDLFKEKYSFDSIEKQMIGLTVLADTNYLESSRYTSEDNKIFLKISQNLDIENIKKKYFKMTDFTADFNQIIKANSKVYNNPDSGVLNRVLISSYSYKHYDEIVKTLKKTSKKWLLIWNNYLLRETKICNCKKEITISGIMTSTHLAIIKIEN